MGPTLSFLYAEQYDLQKLCGVREDGTALPPYHMSPRTPHVGPGSTWSPQDQRRTTHTSIHFS